MSDTPTNNPEDDDDYIPENPEHVEHDEGDAEDDDG